jgi:hypothetical protein
MQLTPARGEKSVRRSRKQRRVFDTKIEMKTNDFLIIDG